jgi:apolipoprotein N-acyltransferase
MCGDDSSGFSWREVGSGLGLSVISAFLFAAAFPPFNLWPLIFIGLAPMIFAQHRLMPEKLSGVAYGIGVGGFFGLYFRGMFENGPWFMQALPLLIALVAAAASSRDRRFHVHTGYRWFLLQGPLVWVGIELIRGVIPTMGTWGFAAYALYNQPWLIQPVSIFGVYGLSFLILTVNYALALGMIDYYDRRRGHPKVGPMIPPSVSRNSYLGAGIGTAAWLTLSLVLLIAPVSGQQVTVRTAAVQPALKVQTWAGVEDIMGLTREAANRGADLVVWHEGALPFDPREENPEAFQELASELDIHLVIGYGLETEPGYRNEALILTPEGEFLGPYGKDHPVAWSGEKSLTRGPHRAYPTSLGRLGMIICYDLDFTDSIRKVAQDGARLVAVPSLDWPAIAAKHYTHLVFRAVENRTAVVKADIAFDSALIDPRGRILASAVSAEAEREILIAEIPLGPQQTWVRHLGDWFGWLCLVGMIAVLGSYPFQT